MLKSLYWRPRTLCAALVLAGTALACSDQAVQPTQPFSISGPSTVSDTTDDAHGSPDLKHDHGGSHFRLGHIAWKKTGATTSEFTYVTAMRRSAFGSVTVGQKLQMWTVHLGDGNRVSPAFTVTFVDATNDWFEARAVFSHTYAAAGPYDVTSSGCCRVGTSSTPGWAHMNNPDHSVRYQARVNFAAAGNAASSLPAMVTCPTNGSCSFNVTAGTPDGASIRYRLATTGELGDSRSTNPPGASVDAATGLYRWNSAAAAVHSDASRKTVYSTQVVMETFDAGGAVVTRSMIDFLIRLANVAVNAPPGFEAPTPSDGNTYVVAPGTAFSLPLAARDPDAADQVTITAVGLPAGATITAPAGNPTSGTLSWTPSTADAGVHIVSLSATDSRGLSGSPRSYRITVPADNTPPSITATVTGTAGSNGWYTSPVSVSWSVTDAESAVSSTSGCEAASVTGDDAGITFTCSATSAGGSASESVTIKVDATAPDVSGALAGTLGSNGWYRSNVGITWTVTDATSGVATSCADAALTSDGTDTFTCTATDNAGNSASASVTAKRDATAPSIASALAGTLGSNGWYRSNVGITWTVTDATSGVATSCADAALTVDGTQTFSCTASDHAGNSASASVTAKRDATNPVVAYTGALATYTVDQSVGISCSASDATSGLASDSCVDIAGPAYSFTLGANSFSASATDRAGNTGTGSVTFTVQVTESSLCALATRWAGDLAGSLCSKLNNAAAAGARGSTGARSNMIRAFSNEVEAQSGKKIPAAQAAILLRLARAL